MSDVSLPRYALKKGPRGTLTQDVLAQLREAIVLGTIAPGAPLRLEELADVLGVSVSPVREALRQLEIIGLAEHIPHRGARVSMLTIDEMQETYEIRGALETLAIRRAAARFTEADADVARSVLGELEQAYAMDDIFRIIRGNTDFHLAITHAARSAGLERLIAAACETSERYTVAMLKVKVPAEMQEIERAGHLAIVEACVAHDVDRAEAELQAHLGVFETMVTFELAEPDAEPGA